MTMAAGEGLAEFNDLVGDAFNALDFSGQLVHVELFDGQEADVAAMVGRSGRLRAYVAAGIARYTSGLIIAESHLLMGDQQPGWLKQQHIHYPLPCAGFAVGEDGVFRAPSSMLGEPLTPVDMDQQARSHWVGARILNDLSGSRGATNLLIDPDRVWQVRRLYQGAAGWLFVDPALDLALAQRLPQSTQARRA
jgi:hypothetical protein